MLEVVFSDSEKGSMKVAKNYNEKNMLGGAVGYIGKKPTKAELEKYFEGQAVGGNSQDVVNIGFSLDIGDISGTIDGKAVVCCPKWYTHTNMEKWCSLFNLRILLCLQFIKKY